MKECVIDIETTTFTPWEQGRIICIGVLDVETKKANMFHDQSEETLLIRFLRHYKKNQYRLIIGFNISYDLRFLFSRCLKFNIPAPYLFKTKSYDLMLALKSVNPGYNLNKPGTLDEWSKAILGRRKLFSNKQIPEMYFAGRLDDIVEYCENDLDLEYQLWKKISFVLGKTQPFFKDKDQKNTAEPYFRTDAVYKKPTKKVI